MVHSPSNIEEDSTRDDEEARNDFWTITGEFILSSPRCTPSQTVRAERRNISYSDEVHSTLSKQHIRPRDVLLEKHIEDYWHVDGERKLSDAWTGFTRFILRKEGPKKTNNFSSR